MRYLKILLFGFFVSALMIHCSRKGEAIHEPRFGIYNFTTYTVDTFQFRIIFNGVVITDSLLSPVGFFAKDIGFLSTNTSGRLQVIDVKNNNQLIMDTSLTMQTGVHFISLVQLLHGQKPYVPAPPGNEPLPGTAKYKVRFQYTPFIGEPGFPPQPFLYDSIMCYIRKNGVVIDTVVLKKYELSGFYEGGILGADTYTMIIDDPSNGNRIDDATSPTVGATFTGFNTVSVSGRAVIDDWVLMRMY